MAGYVRRRGRRRDGSTKWQARWRNPNDHGQRLEKTFVKRQDAERWLTEMEHNALAGSYVDPRHADQPYRELAEAWKDTWVNLSPKTRAGYTDILESHLVPEFGSTKLIEDCSLAEWRRTLEINLTSTFLCCRAAIPQMRRQNAGRIVNLASIAGKEGNASMTPYSAAKGGAIALTKALGKELADTEVRVNCVAPAVIATDLVKQMAPETYDAVIAKTPLGRPGRAEEVAALVAWLASDECSFSTGACFDLTGGRATY